MLYTIEATRQDVRSAKRVVEKLKEAAEEKKGSTLELSSEEFEVMKKCLTLVAQGQRTVHKESEKEGGEEET